MLASSPIGGVPILRISSKLRPRKSHNSFSAVLLLFLLVYFELLFYSSLVFLDGRTIKRSEVIAMAAAKKKLAPPLRKTVAAAPTPLSKRSRSDAETASEAPMPKKRVKKLTKKGERDIHVISSQTQSKH